MQARWGRVDWRPGVATSVLAVDHEQRIAGRVRVVDDASPVRRPVELGRALDVPSQLAP